MDKKICQNCFKDKIPIAHNLCKDCLMLLGEQKIFFDENFGYIEKEEKANVLYYCASKHYTKKKLLQTNEEKELYILLNKWFKKDYLIVPQVVIQALVDTDNNTRNIELFKILDFVLFKNNLPIIAIEIGGSQHEKDLHTRTRDYSASKILERANIKFIRFKNSDLEDTNYIKKEIKKIIEQ